MGFAAHNPGLCAIHTYAKDAVVATVCHKDVAITVYIHTHGAIQLQKKRESEGVSMLRVWSNGWQTCVHPPFQCLVVQACHCLQWLPQGCLPLLEQSRARGGRQTPPR